ncbi:MAG: SHOCT domain-containing protein [Desulforhopalus sp.]|nr:SHOCT domain-containing protein [Desulforhopalus sp.]
MKCNLVRSVLALALLTFCIQGCANQFSYSNTNVSFAATGSGKLAIATHDQRPYIVSGKKSPDFIGLVRGGYGNPFDVTTASGKSLSEEITGALAASFQKSGFTTVPVAISHSENDKAIKDKILAAKSDKAVLFVVKEWKSDTLVNTALLFDLSLQVLDGSANIIVERQIGGNDDLGGSTFNVYKHSHTAVPKAFQAKLEEIINSPEIQMALTTGSPAAPVAARPASAVAGRSAGTVPTRPAEPPMIRTEERIISSGASDSPQPPSGGPAYREMQNTQQSAAGDVESRLEKLRGLFDRGLISEDEYYRERTRVLGSM